MYPCDETWPPLKTPCLIIAMQMGTSELSALHNASQQLVVHNRDSGCPSKCGEAVSDQALLSGVTPLQSWAL